MLYRKIDFTFWGLTLLEMALKWITLNKMERSLVHCGNNALEFLAQKTRLQLRILNVPFGKSHIGVWALSYALHLRCEKFLLVWQGNIVSHYIRKKLTVMRKCCIE